MSDILISPFAGSIRQYLFSTTVGTGGLVIGGSGASGVDVSPRAAYKMVDILGTPTPVDNSELPNSYLPLLWEVRNVSASGVLRWCFGDAAVDKATLLTQLAGTLPVPPATGLLNCQRLGPGVGWSDFPRDSMSMLPKPKGFDPLGDPIDFDDSILRRRSALVLQSESGNIDVVGSVYAWVLD